MFQILKRVVPDLVSPCRFAQAIIERGVEPHLRIAECRNKHRHPFLIGRLQNSTLPLGVLGEICPDGVVQLVGTHDFIVVPGFENRRHHLFDIIEVLLRLEGVVDAVVALLIEFFVRDFRIGAEMRPPGRLDQPVSHQGAGRDNRIHDPAINELGHDQALLGDRHGACQSHYNERVVVERHRLQDVSRFAKLTARESRLGHGSHQSIDRRHFRQIQRFQRNQAVLDGIMQMSVFAFSASVPLSVVRIAMIAVFQRKPPSRLRFCPTEYSTGSI